MPRLVYAESDDVPKVTGRRAWDGGDILLHITTQSPSFFRVPHLRRNPHGSTSSTVRLSRHFSAGKCEDFPFCAITERRISSKYEFNYDEEDDIPLSIPPFELCRSWINTEQVMIARRIHIQNYVTRERNAIARSGGRNPRGGRARRPPHANDRGRRAPHRSPCAAAAERPAAPAAPPRAPRAPTYRTPADYEIYEDRIV
ncbi:hypothetical protein EVAR_65445_1 [Eumeta japonica]|uniref:Uncharacterized protein n=1 Tax=Eumeta variegata TaxID=151549 RepID=A0A4C1ZG16_EUMVA|nr:hypothetical protein EVAR_65445_1 [Eumeta japonica]